ncbi:MAG: polysaccharide deacetylase family protein [Candidatus Krumholzibacteria bacterium]|nr:polysaccharide deacetylase family protein [Candidatus Krumholzibacteria bacterium]
MIVIAAIVAFFVFLYVVWKIRYRYPPADMPQVLCYHKLSGKFCFEGTWMPPQRFVRQIDHLIAGGFEFIGEEGFIAALNSPAADNAKKILLTFDDGYEALYDVHRTHLEPRGIPCSVFIVTDYVGCENRWDISLGRRPFRHLTWHQIEDLARRGVSFGSHGASHRDLTRLQARELSREVTFSRSVIEEHVQKRVKSFSYPFGRYNDDVRDVVAKSGYELAFSLYPPRSNEQIDPFALRRNGVYIIDTPLSIECKLQSKPFFWFEEMKCRTINRVAILTPIFKRSCARPDK